MELMLDRLHAAAVRSVALQRFADFTRVLLAVGFFAPGLHKLLGIPFTTIGVDNPIGAFFHALHQTGFYYRFIGASQVLAAVLVLFRRTSTLGALMFFPITLNIFVVTVSIDFGTGTPIVTGLMLLASLYPVCWDYDKLKPLLPFAAFDALTRGTVLTMCPHPSALVGKIGFWVFAVAGCVTTCAMRGLIGGDTQFRRGGLLLSLVGGLLMLSGFVLDVVRRSPPAVRSPVS